jgi:FMN phosphatase YigB (HAD superfamily)
MLSSVSNIEKDDQRITEKRLRYPSVLFDWGDTVMRDDPEITIPMVEWETIEVIDGIADVLGYLHSSDRQILLATSASISDESQIWGALARGRLDEYFSRIYCFKNTHLPKGKEFYHHILNDLQIPTSDILMVGDGFERDVLDANAVGIFAVWFNPKSEETRTNELHITVHSMHELRAFFQSLD